MTQSLSRLINHPIDYAGLYPPASLDMRTALASYGEVLDSDNSWIVNRFVCSASRLEECIEMSAEFIDEETGEGPLIDFVVIGTPLVKGATAAGSLQTDIEQARNAMHKEGVEAYEIRLPLGSELEGCLGALKKQFKWFNEREVDVYIEFPWADGMHEAMALAASSIEGIGFKARVGGVKKEHFPSIDQVAGFIAEVSGLEAQFKFTAGMHEPVRHYDKDLDCYHHGFFNVFVASALAMIKHATITEIEQILAIEDGKQFKFTDQTVECLGNSLSLKDLDEWWLYFGGFGSCSYDEPLEGLKKLGLI